MVPETSAAERHIPDPDGRRRVFQPTGIRSVMPMDEPGTIAVTFTLGGGDALLLVLDHPIAPDLVGMLRETFDCVRWPAEPSRDAATGHPDSVDDARRLLRLLKREREIRAEAKAGAASGSLLDAFVDGGGVERVMNRLAEQVRPSGPG